MSWTWRRRQVSGKNNLLLDRRGHVYVEVHWPDASGRACWDTGSGATIVDRGFWVGHPELFEQIGVSVGTDGNGEQAGRHCCLWPSRL